MLTGCASRAVPFDKLETANITVLKLQAATPPSAAPATAIPGLPFLPPELQAQGQALLQQLKQSGLLPPIPGLVPGPQAQPQAPAAPMFRGQWQIAGSVPITDEPTRNMLLDLFGESENFNNQMRCAPQTPGMAISFQSPELPEAVDVVIQVSCNSVAGYGFAWPHQNNFGMTPTTSQQLVGIYQSLFRQQLPPGA